MSRVAIHQPNYLPWPGYFMKMMLCDSFVFLDHVQFSKGSFTNRLLLPSGADQSAYITIPVPKDANKFNINALPLKQNAWRQDHKSRMHGWLKHLTHRKDLEFIMDEYSRDDFSTLAAFNINLIQVICNQLNITCPITLSSSHNLQSKASELVGELVLLSQGKSYLTGTGFLKYYKKESWPSDVSIDVIDFKQLMKDSDLSTFSIVENIARLGLESVIDEMQKIVTLHP